MVCTRVLGAGVGCIRTSPDSEAGEHRIDQQDLPIVEGMKTGKLKWDVYERKHIQVRRYGNIAVLIGQTTFKTSDAPKASELRFTQVWVKRYGNWQRAVYHNAFAAAIPAPPTKQ